MSTYLGQVPAVMEEFDILMPVTTNMEKQQEHMQTLFLVLTFAGLPPDHDLVHDQILASPTVSKIDDLFSCLLCLAMHISHKIVYHPPLTPLCLHRKLSINEHIVWRIKEVILEDLDPSVVIVISLDTFTTYVIVCMVHRPVMILLLYSNIMSPFKIVQVSKHLYQQHLLLSLMILFLSWIDHSIMFMLLRQKMMGSFCIGASKQTSTSSLNSST